ncbi:heavy metal translocating P-type ATPase [Kineothrix sp. MSJ-39]|uniref:heavy metal translocating P-type ATPase n=1 Tax=Kineothrix sp. MSJ-39 TaxID=2841533 RepID=UPI001C11FBE0|nr:heavy metal translocating P-type ATPase [Kineothrix sp. MSJ-39]MBU5429936.1 heavy metal translocating P-type ATPase [Kineothrix sp. MSJ-39]
MTKKLKKRLYRIIAGAVCYAACMAMEKLAPVSNNVLLIAFLVTYFIIGGDVLKGAAQNIIKGQIFDEKFLMVIATIGAFLSSQYPEAVAVMLFYQIGEWFQSYAVNKSRRSIKDLMDIRPDYANVYNEAGELVSVDPDEVSIGTTIVVKPGEKIPLDGEVIKGETSLDTMALTGESLPREIRTGDEVISGCINLSGVIEVKTNKEFGESTVAKILNLVENATAKKAEAENFISKFAKYYTPIVVFLAVALAIIPSVITGAWGKWVYRALCFLVISCPCALVISIPLSFFGGIGAASKAGILVKGSNYLEALANAETIVMDKTGTLTKGQFAVTKIMAVNESEQRVLAYGAFAERLSTHPISKSIMAAYQQKNGDMTIMSSNEAVEEKAGFGVVAQKDGGKIAVGNEKLMAHVLGADAWAACKEKYLAGEKALSEGTICHIAYNDVYWGFLLIEDQLKEDAAECVTGLKKAGMRLVMLTGDQKGVADKVAGQLGITEYYAELLPGDKVDHVEKLLAEKSEKGKLIFVGDGINDAPVLARADIGIAMGGLGSDAAIEAADIVIMTDEPAKITTAMHISKKTLEIVKQNIIFAIGVKILVLILAALGVASMWWAVFADVGVAFIAILNAMRALKLK